MAAALRVGRVVVAAVAAAVPPLAVAATRPGLEVAGRTTARGVAEVGGAGLGPPDGGAAGVKAGTPEEEMDATRARVVGAVGAAGAVPSPPLVGEGAEVGEAKVPMARSPLGVDRGATAIGGAGAALPLPWPRGP